MAEHTDQNLLHQVIYSVFVRNHTKEGTFRALESDLDRLKGLGADIIWLMPIHPIGSEGRKGTLGSPYAIQDYRGINPEYGTREDFIHLVDAIHARGMKCIIDVVYNHTCESGPEGPTICWTPCWPTPIRSTSSATQRVALPERWRTGGMWWTWITETATCGTTRSTH